MVAVVSLDHEPLLFKLANHILGVIGCKCAVELVHEVMMGHAGVEESVRYFVCWRHGSWFGGVGVDGGGRG